jgi:hypothetical protein
MNVYVQSKKPVIRKKMMRLIVLQKNEINTMEAEKISPVAKYLSGTANPIETGIASRYVVFSFGFWGHFSGRKF